jgi:hypothetical protein
MVLLYTASRIASAVPPALEVEFHPELAMWNVFVKPVSGWRWQCSLLIVALLFAGDTGRMD